MSLSRFPLHHMRMIPVVNSDGRLHVGIGDGLFRRLKVSPRIAQAIQIVLVSKRTDKFLSEVFSTQLASVECKKLRSHRMLPKIDLTKTPLLNTMLGGQCSIPPRHWTKA